MEAPEHEALLPMHKFLLREGHDRRRWRRRERVEKKKAKPKKARAEPAPVVAQETLF